MVRFRPLPLTLSTETDLLLLFLSTVGGEIDVFEGVNLQTVNQVRIFLHDTARSETDSLFLSQMALHTTGGCNATNTTSANPFTGTLLCASALPLFLPLPY
jgi:hypothetical protein